MHIDLQAWNSNTIIVFNDTDDDDNNNIDLQAWNSNAIIVFNDTDDDDNDNIVLQAWNSNAIIVFNDTDDDDNNNIVLHIVYNWKGVLLDLLSEIKFYASSKLVSKFKFSISVEVWSFLYVWKFEVFYKYGSFKFSISVEVLSFQ